MARGRHGSLQLAVVVIAGPAPGASAAQVSASRAVTPGGFYVQRLSLAATPSGGRSALLVAGNRLHPIDNRLLARLGRGTSLGPGRWLDGGATSIRDAKVAVGGDGTVVAAWQATFADDERVERAHRGRDRGAGARLRDAADARIDVVAGLLRRCGREPARARCRQLVEPSARRRGGPRRVPAPGRRFAARQTLGVGAAPQLAVAPSGRSSRCGARAARRARRRPRTRRCGPSAARFGQFTTLPSAPGRRLERRRERRSRRRGDLPRRAARDLAGGRRTSCASRGSGASGPPRRRRSRARRLEHRRDGVRLPGSRRARAPCSRAAIRRDQRARAVRGRRGRGARRASRSRRARRPPPGR